jgi:DNA-binding FadR family transcriptional regulator
VPLAKIKILERGVALTDEAIDKIKQMITSGRVRPGEKLPREADLAAELGLSRNSLREAVRVLSLANDAGANLAGNADPHAKERTLAEHRAIYKAIMSRDGDLARSRANVHIAGIESWLRTALAD